MVSATATTAATGTGPGGAIPQLAGNSGLLEMSPGHPISLQDVRVFRYRRVGLSADWTALMTIDGQPWVALRRDVPSGGGGKGAGRGDAVTWVYLASEIAPAETNWLGDPSFVIFFSNLVGQLGQPGAAAFGGRVQEWQMKALAVSGMAPAAARRYGVAPYLAGAAVVLVLLAAGLFVRRGSR